ncbi:type 2 lanthipeptide synthetase LanM family protein [Nostoc sp. CALU 1950]|uniref:type 2 lanthipeptide synthetase LanM family protein n=1 Tax=Nostoc sp. CALU 1950 TaxID=3104321 RepID=UPI003EBF3161
MTINQPELNKIITQARSLSECLSNRLYNFETDEKHEQKASVHLNRWCQVVAQGNWDKFHKRLQWDGLDINTLSSVLETQHNIANNSSLPAWAQTLTEIIKIASEFTFDHKSKISIDLREPLLFEDILLPALSVARQKLLTCLGSAVLSSDYLPLELLCEEAYLSLERNLLQNLVNLCSKTLELEFSRFRPFGHSFVNLLEKQTNGSPSKIHYNAFVQNLLQDGLMTFFQKYPVLGKLVATAIDFWVEATVEFLQRLQADLSEIQQLFPCEPINQEKSALTQLGKVREIKPALSDPHHRGRTAIAITFESGLKLVYKPKDLGLEVAYNQFLEWCNQREMPLSLKVLKVFNRQGYGWVEYVEHLPCEDEAAAQRFYQRAGMLLCLLYVLQGTDCHNENLIASGEHLVLIDMETLLHHEAKIMEISPEAKEAQTANIPQLWDLVLRTGLLPRWDFSQDNRIAYDISGLGNIDPQQTPKRASYWKSINTDDMHLGYKTVTMPIQKNVPILNGVALSPNDYLEELVTGFQQMYLFLGEQRQALLATDSPLTKLQAQRIRFVFRATQVYGVILQKTLAPEFLQSGINRSIELDILSRAFLIAQDKPNAWSILHSELRAMEQLDVPYFAASSDSDALTVGLEQPIEKYFQAPSYDQVVSRLQKLDQVDLAQQIAIIQGAFYARVAQTPGTEPANTVKEAQISQINALTSEKLLQHSQEIAQEIQARGITGTDGSIHWIGLAYLSDADRFQLQPLDASLFNGNCGIAIFLSALDYVRGNNQFRNLTLGALQPIRKFLQITDAQLAQRFASSLGIGGATGLGSIIYSLVRISQFLKEPSLLEDARRAAQMISPELIAADTKFDILAGSAGAILGLLALYRQTADSAVLEKAIACGQHLLEHQISVGGSPKAWINFAEQPLTGFSHGAAGISYALLQLYAVTDDWAYLKAAQEGIIYESRVFSQKSANWPDFRNPGSVCMVTWCHGAPGIGLARLGGLSILETEEIHQDIEIALQTTQKYGLQNVDHLCCGNFGRMEVLLVGAQKLGRESLRTLAQQQAASVVARAEQMGAYQLFPNLPNHVFSPSFFQGNSGIGYELLRLAYPNVLPSVLLWE